MLREPHAIIVIINGIIAICLNLFVLAALYQVKNRMTPHHRFIISLAISDICVGGSVMFHVINHVFNPTYKPGTGLHTVRLISMCTFLVIKALNTTGLNATQYVYHTYGSMYLSYIT